MDHIRKLTLEYNRELIADYAKPIFKKIKEGWLFGEPIDTNDINALVLSAYMLGQQEERKDAREIQDKLEAIRAMKGV